MKRDLSNKAEYPDDAIYWGLRFWWPLRHGTNAGNIREIIQDYVKELRERK